MEKIGYRVKTHKTLKIIPDCVCNIRYVIIIILSTIQASKIRRNRRGEKNGKGREKMKNCIKILM